MTKKIILALHEWTGTFQEKWQRVSLRALLWPIVVFPYLCLILVSMCVELFGLGLVKLGNLILAANDWLWGRI